MSKNTYQHAEELERKALKKARKALKVGDVPKATNWTQIATMAHHLWKVVP